MDSISPRRIAIHMERREALRDAHELDDVDVDVR
jgi:hypothetical protein